MVVVDNKIRWVSAVSGEGLNRLRAALTEVAAQVGSKSIAGHARLPVDRSFSMRGHGTVVTGTLVSGTKTKIIYNKDKNIGFIPQ